jgi:DNA-binding CsgD family transcriptional regulator
MLDDASFRRLKRRYRETGAIDAELFALLRRLVFALVFQRAFPPAYSPTAKWDEEGAEEALASWTAKRLVATNALSAAFDHASAARPFIRSLERNLRHHLQNERERGEIDNLLERTARLLRDDARFREWIPQEGASWWGLAGDRQPPPFGGRDDELVANAWAIGDVVLWIYSSSVERASPVLATTELGRFLEELFGRTKALLTLGHLAVVFRRRFNLDEPTRVSLHDEHESLPNDEEPLRDEEGLRAAAIAVLSELSDRQVEVILRKRDQPLETIASALGISRGTVDNELRRAGEAIDRQTADFSRDEILEKILDVLS